MSINPYFHQYPKNPSTESDLLDDLIQESIQIYGASVWYVERNTRSSVDPLYGEDSGGSVFNKAYQMEMYLQNVMGYEGQSEFFSKFALEIRDTARFILARRVFQKYVPGSERVRPREGDLLWVPQLNNIFEIKFVEEEKDFYSLGRRPPYFYYYELQAEVFKFSNEKFITGIEALDQIATNYYYTQMLSLSGITGQYTIGEQVYQGANSSSYTASANVKSWNTQSSVLNIVNIIGTFANGNTIIGTTSNARGTVASYDPQDFSGVTEEISENDIIEQEAENSLDDTWSEDNPFGQP